MSRLPRSGVVAWALAGAVAWLIAFAAATWATEGQVSAARFVDNVAYLVPVAGAAGLSTLAWIRARQPRDRRVWALLAWSNLLWLVGELIWAFYVFGLHDDAPFPSVADLFYLASYLPVPVALLTAFGAAARLRRRRAVVDALVVTAALGGSVWLLLIAPQLGGTFSLATATSIAYPLLDVMVLVVLISAGPAGHRRVPASMIVIGAAFTVSACTDVAYTYLASLHDYLSSSWLNVGWQAEAVLLCLAAVIALRHEETDSEARVHDRDLGLFPVLLAVAVSVTLVMVDGLHDGLLEPVSLWVAATTLAGVVARLLMSTADARATARQLDVALRHQEQLAVTDALTTVFNRRFFDEMLRLETDRAKRVGHGLGLLMIDLDNFKRVNDCYGHQSGDSVLVEVADRLRKTLRSNEILARYGGEEFAVILPTADLSALLQVAGRCRQVIRELPFPVRGDVLIGMTLSIGAARLRPHEDSAAELLARADDNMYRAKSSGRDAVVLDAESAAGTVSVPTQHNGWSGERA